MHQTNQSKTHNTNFLGDPATSGLTEAALSLLLTLTEDNPEFSKALTNSPLYQQLEQHTTPHSLAIMCNISLNDSLITNVFTSLMSALREENEHALNILLPTATNILLGPNEKPIEGILPDLLSLLKSCNMKSEVFGILTNLVLEFPDECVTESFFQFYTGLMEEHVNDPAFCHLLMALCTVTSCFTLLDQAQQHATNPECIDILRGLDEDE